MIDEHPGARVVAERGTSPQISDKLAQLGATALTSGTTREETYLAMLEHQALLGGGASGRYWFLADWPVADALLTLSLLLTILSQSDRPLSMVLDAAILGS
jgi:phosphomannomutase